MFQNEILVNSIWFYLIVQRSFVNDFWHSKYTQMKWFSKEFYGTTSSMKDFEKLFKLFFKKAFQRVCIMGTCYSKLLHSVGVRNSPL